MKTKTWVLAGIVLLLSVILTACDGLGLSPSPSRTGPVSQPSPTLIPFPNIGPNSTTGPAIGQPFRYHTDVIASRLEVPWAMAFATQFPAKQGQPAETGLFLFVTERAGRLRLIVDGQLEKDPVLTIKIPATDEGGLLGLALDPHFRANGQLYVMYTYQGRSGLRHRISRFTFQGRRAGGEKVLLEDIPAGTIHDGGRLMFGPDGKLYATVGETTQRELAQRVDSLAGKILRLNADGSIPNDNPFRGSPVYSYGHRNPQGLAWQPGTGQLFSTEHGPSSAIESGLCCHDEINLIKSGANYGWPLVVGKAGDPRFVDPIHESGASTWAPSGAVFYDGQLLGPWRDSLFFGSLRGLHLHRLVLGGANGNSVIAEEELFRGQFGRIRDVAVGPEGALYFTTSNRDQRWPPKPDDDLIVRIIPGS